MYVHRHLFPYGGFKWRSDQTEIFPEQTDDFRRFYFFPLQPVAREITVPFSQNFHFHFSDLFFPHCAHAYTDAGSEFRNDLSYTKREPISSNESAHIGIK